MGNMKQINRFRHVILDATCQQNPCSNNGSCFPKQTLIAGINAVVTECQCPNGFYGDLCQYKNFCNPNSCQNNGECSLIGQTSYSCKCNHSFLGENCELGMKCGPWHKKKQILIIKSI